MGCSGCLVFIGILIGALVWLFSRGEVANVPPAMKNEVTSPKKNPSAPAEPAVPVAEPELPSPTPAEAIKELKSETTNRQLIETITGKMSPRSNADLQKVNDAVNEIIKRGDAGRDARWVLIELRSSSASDSSKILRTTIDDAFKDWFGAENVVRVVQAFDRRVVATHLLTTGPELLKHLDQGRDIVAQAAWWIVRNPIDQKNSPDRVSAIAELAMSLLPDLPANDWPHVEAGLKWLVSSNEAKGKDSRERVIDRLPELAGFPGFSEKLRAVLLAELTLRQATDEANRARYQKIIEQLNKIKVKMK
ncbi:hypothetical protein [Tuwongella immobilis]|nr:hypothetical protein [Tuwongella immobilis]